MGGDFQNRRNDSFLTSPERLLSCSVFDTVATALQSRRSLNQLRVGRQPSCIPVEPESSRPRTQPFTTLLLNVSTGRTKGRARSVDERQWKGHR